MKHDDFLVYSCRETLLSKEKFNALHHEGGEFRVTLPDTSITQSSLMNRCLLDRREKRGRL